MNFKNFIKSGICWALSLILAFSAVNLACFFYERPTAWFDTPNGPSPAGWRPNSILVHGTEGYGIARADSNGYLNPNGTLRNGYILIMGSSHTQGKEVSPDQKYSSLVNRYFSQEENVLTAYNIGCDGNFLPSLIKHFNAAVQAFPGASVITAEISSVEFSPEALESALEQVSYVAENSIAQQAQSAGTVVRIKNIIKEYLPLLSLIKSKLDTAAAAKTAEPETEEPEQTDAAQYAAALNHALALIRSETDCPIVFVYHPTLKLQPDGTVTIDYEQGWPVFRKACERNHISVIDMGPVFEGWYYEHRQLPYGFFNTAPGSGHLNRTGHQLIADTLIKYIEEAAL